jgi:hypothetical protein
VDNNQLHTALLRCRYGFGETTIFILHGMATEFHDDHVA